jgi:transposase InsO family protein
MRLMRLVPIYQEPKTSKKHPEHRIYPYLLKELSIARPNQVWCTDISYIPMRRGFLYLVAVMDWHSRKVLSWRLSNSMDAGFCVEALKEALARYGPPEIFNWECPELCVSGSAHAGFRYGHALKRSSNMIANWFRAANHSRTFLPCFSKLRMAR